MSKLQVVAATANPNKLVEIQAVIDEFVQLTPRPEHVAEVIEDAKSFVGNARKKAQAIMQATNQPALADDTGLEVHALDGAPGVESAYFSGGDHDDAANRQKVLELLNSLGCTSAEQRAAQFRTVFCLLWPNGDELIAEGICSGHIASGEAGEGGFGYDSIFVPEAGDGRTFAEMSADEKNEISHRSLACQALLKKLSQL